MTLTQILDLTVRQQRLWEWLCNYRLNLAEVLEKPRISKLELSNSQPLNLSMALYI